MSDLADVLRAEIETTVAAEVERAVAELRHELAERDREWMTAGECAEWLRWPVKRIRNLTAAGRLPHVRDGGRVLYHRPTVRRWLLAEQAEVQTAGPAPAPVMNGPFQ